MTMHCPATIFEGRGCRHHADDAPVAGKTAMNSAEGPGSRCFKRTSIAGSQQSARRRLARGRQWS